MSDETITAPAIAPKIYPEILVIRARPRRAIRFRRGAIVGIAVLGSASLMTIAWVALKPISFHHVVEQQQQSQPSSRPATDALNGLPASYAETPKLGPPPPGDLGRPILSEGRDPGVVRKLLVEANLEAGRQTFERVVRDWFKNAKPSCGRTARPNWSITWSERGWSPDIRDRPINGR